MLLNGYDVQVTQRRNCKRIILRCRDGAFSMSVPPGTSLRRIEAFVKANEVWMRSALEKSPPPKHALDPQRLEGLIRRMLPEWEARMGVKAGRICYREMVSRWGSCQPKTGNITLNLRLAGKCEACVEYVLVHELCHLIHPDHSPAFHAAMTRLMPDWRSRRAQLNDWAASDIP